MSDHPKFAYAHRYYRNRRRELREFEKQLKEKNLVRDMPGK